MRTRFLLLPSVLVTLSCAYGAASASALPIQPPSVELPPAPKLPSIPSPPKVPAQPPQLPSSPSAPSLGLPGGGSVGGGSQGGGLQGSTGNAIERAARGLTGSGASAAGGAAGRGAGPAASPAQRRRAVARRGRARRRASQFRRTVRRLEPCFYAVSNFERSVLSLRAGLEGRPRSRGNTARKLGVSKARVAHTERHALHALKRTDGSDHCGRTSPNEGVVAGSLRSVVASSSLASLGTGTAGSAGGGKGKRSGASGDEGGVLGAQATDDAPPAIGHALGNAPAADVSDGGPSPLFFLLLATLALGAALLMRRRRRPATASDAGAAAAAGAGTGAAAATALDSRKPEPRTKPQGKPVPKPTPKPATADGNGRDTSIFPAPPWAEQDDEPTQGERKGSRVSRGDNGHRRRPHIRRPS